MAKMPIDLTKKKTRDKGGPIGSHGFTYQVHWAFLKLIELHKTNDEYLIVMDYHDDVVIANNETAPTKIDFYQVKTSRASDWSATRLLKKRTLKKSKSLSILGKLYDHRVNFPANKGLLGFVSHRHCGLDMPAKLKIESIVPFSKLDAACKQRLVAAIRVEHGLSSDPDCDSFVFIKAPLRIESDEEDLKGILTTFTEGLVPSGKFEVSNFYRVIADELRKQSDNQDTPQNMAELSAKKAIARSKVQKIIDRMMPSDHYQKIWQTIPSAHLEGIGMGMHRNIGEGFTRYAAHKQDRTNRVGKAVGQTIRKALESADVDKINNLMALFAEVLPKLTGLPKSADDNYIKGAITLEWYDHGNRQLQATDPKSQGAAA